MRSFTIEVYNCDQCPSADHDTMRCQEHLNNTFSINGENVFEDYQEARRIYVENTFGLCHSCPRV